MLAGLRHDPIVGGDDQECAVYRAHARQHVIDKVDVAGNVHEAEGVVDLLAVDAGGEMVVGVTGDDGEPAVFLFGQRVGIDAGDVGDQGCLAVIDMPGGGEDE